RLRPGADGAPSPPRLPAPLLPPGLPASAGTPRHLPGRSGRPWAPRGGGGAPGDAYGGRRERPVRAGEPRGRPDPPPGRRSDQEESRDRPDAAPVRGPALDPPEPVPRGVPRLRRVAAAAPGAGRRPAGRGARRAEERAHRARLARGAPLRL